MRTLEELETRLNLLLKQEIKNCVPLGMKIPDTIDGRKKIYAAATSAYQAFYDDLCQAERYEYDIEHPIYVNIKELVYIKSHA